MMEMMEVMEAQMMEMMQKMEMMMLMKVHGDDGDGSYFCGGTLPFSYETLPAIPSFSDLSRIYYRCVREALPYQKRKSFLTDIKKSAQMSAATKIDKLSNIP